MRKLPLVLSTFSFALAVIVFVFTSGARSIYSGLFFMGLGAVLLVGALRKEGNAAK